MHAVVRSGAAGGAGCPGLPHCPLWPHRPADAAALATVACPTLIVQGDHDKLGPIDILRPLIQANPRVELVVVPGVGHAFGAAEPTAVELTSDWLVQRRTTL